MNNNNVATEITRFQKNMVALENLPSENLVHPTPLIIQPPPDNKLPPQLLKSSPKTILFFSPHPFARGGGGAFYKPFIKLILKKSSALICMKDLCNPTARNGPTKLILNYLDFFA